MADKKKESLKAKKSSGDDGIARDGDGIPYGIKWSTNLVQRPFVTVQQIDQKEDAETDKTDQVRFPDVFMSPIRPNIVKFVHGNMRKNKRQPYAVYVGAGHQHSAESWGTGRAVSRIPRVSGGGTSRAGQGAFGNMCRSGRMFAPTKTWRKWHVKMNRRKKRFATVSCIAASALPALVEARGHRIQEVPEIPLVVENAIESLQKTKDAINFLESVGAYEDVEKVKDTKHTRPGKGKMRNRRYVLKKGPLIVYKENHGICQAFRNLSGVELCQVKNLDVIKLAPGGQVGRFIVWSKAAFEDLNDLWGSWNRVAKHKKGYKLPRSVMTHPDLSRIINSVTIQSKVRPRRTNNSGRKWKKNPLKNLGVMVKLNPYALVLKRNEALIQERVAAGCKPKKSYKKKDEHEWKKGINFKRINNSSSKSQITKEQFMRKKEFRKRRQGRMARALALKKEKREAEDKWFAHIKELKEKARKGEKPTLKQISRMIRRHKKNITKKKKVKKRKKSVSKGKKKKKAKTKKISGSISAKPEEAKPFKTYDNDMCIGKEAPLEAIRKLPYIQGTAPPENRLMMVLLWRKSYKNGYKFMPLYSALSEEFKDKPIDFVGVCLDRDKNAASGFLKKYTNGPKGNFTTSFSICEEWAPANKVYPLKGRPVEKGFLDNMADLHPGMKEIPSIPHAFLVNSFGTIVWHQDHSERGSTAPDNMDLMKNQLSRLLTGKTLLAVGEKIVEESDDDESSSDEEDGGEAVGDMGDFFTNL